MYRAGSWRRNAGSDAWNECLASGLPTSLRLFFLRDLAVGFCGQVDVYNFARFVFQRRGWLREAFFGLLFSPFRGGLELAHHSLPARLNIDILDRHLLLSFATISIERFNLLGEN